MREQFFIVTKKNRNSSYPSHFLSLKQYLKANCQEYLSERAMRNINISTCFIKWCVPVQFWELNVLYDMKLIYIINQDPATLIAWQPVAYASDQNINTNYSLWNLRKPWRDMWIFKKAVCKSLYRIVQSVLTD